MKKIISLLSVLATVTVANAQLYTVDIKNFDELKSYFKQDQNKPIIISGHRGGMMPGYPENSIEAFEKTLSIMPSFFEIDPQLTKDSVLILMHDDMFNEDYNAEKLRQLIVLLKRNPKIVIEGISGYPTRIS